MRVFELAGQQLLLVRGWRLEFIGKSSHRVGITRCAVIKFERGPQDKMLSVVSTICSQGEIEMARMQRSEQTICHAFRLMHHGSLLSLKRKRDAAWQGNDDDDKKVS